MLDQSLQRLQTDHLDLWQVHGVCFDNDPELFIRPNGAAEALLKAKEQGKVRFLRFSGHKDPEIHLKMLETGFPFDAVQMPLNVFDASFRSFERHVLPELVRRGMAVFGMKSFGGNGEIIKWAAATPSEALRYAMSLPVATTISGIESLEVLEQNLAIARGFTPMPPEERAQLRERCRPFAADGHAELFKTTMQYDAAVGRAQHHMPPPSEVPA